MTKINHLRQPIRVCGLGKYVYEFDYIFYGLMIGVYSVWQWNKHLISSGTNAATTYGLISYKRNNWKRSKQSTLPKCKQFSDEFSISDWSKSFEQSMTFSTESCRVRLIRHSHTVLFKELIQMRFLPQILFWKIEEEKRLGGEGSKSNSKFDSIHKIIIDLLPVPLDTNNSYKKKENRPYLTRLRLRTRESTIMWA